MDKLTRTIFLYPTDAKCLAMPAPMPALPPVTTSTFSSMGTGGAAAAAGGGDDDDGVSDEEEDAIAMEGLLGASSAIVCK